MRNRVVMVAAVIAVAATLLSNLAGREAGRRAELPEVNYRASSFSLADLNGRLTRLEGYTGQPLLLNFWATWCPPCQTETPDLIDLAEKYQGQVGFIGLNVTVKDSIEQVHRFAKQYGVNYPILLDEEGIVSKQYQVGVLPTTFVINGDGVIVYKKIGAVTKSEVERVIEPLLEQAPRRVAGSQPIE
ncbi:TlpA family protein disulfide reductase [Brevibacillus humidisoli]|uniref:TlpA family protein disulfide reductase n=1 Tax=Brevibacillus humidisoli TaxID=2895522 RepID=UPI001E401ACF|nr:TlpA disulfide reductase family protein [Brevibacillus humidisoli]UFJ40791.1 TlpA family protein disulfide reductase [Brevibacillus humidisoli]